MRHCTLVLVLGLFLSVSAVNGDKSGSDKLQGAWVGTSWKRGEGEVPRDKVATESRQTPAILGRLVASAGWKRAP